jgi:hypothetical protein
MLNKSLKEMTLDELQKLLTISEKNLALSKLHRHGASVIVHNKNRLEQIQKAILDKKKDLLAPE